MTITIWILISLAQTPIYFNSQLDIYESKESCRKAMESFECLRDDLDGTCHLTCYERVMPAQD